MDRDIAALRTVAREVAEHLGPSWQLEETDDDSDLVYILGPNDAAVRIKPDGYAYNTEGRLRIFGRYPHHPRMNLTHGETLPEITVTAKKSPQAIAKDIRRRFLPKYLDLHAQAMERKQVYEHAEAVREDHLQQLAVILNTEPRRDKLYMPGSIGGFAQVSDSNTVKFAIYSVPFETACKIAELLAQN